MDDVECPYCGEEQEINHDDGHGYAGDTVHSQRCDGCGSNFGFETTKAFHYEVKKVPCLNGEDHVWEKVIHGPKYWPDWVRCKACSLDKKGVFCRGEK